MNILHENSHGIQMIRVDMKKRSKVTVRNSYGDYMRTYRFNNIQECFKSPYISWANLDCCGGWACDEAYLDTAVQRGLKLYAGRTQFLKREPYLMQYPTKDEALAVFESMKQTLPSGIVAGEKNYSNPVTHVCIHISAAQERLQIISIWRRCSIFMASSASMLQEMKCADCVMLRSCSMDHPMHLSSTSMLVPKPS